MSAFLYVGEAARGADTVRNEYETKRLRNLEAFDQFRRMNPYASLEDMSAYAEQLSGGSNWLRGQLPAKAVLTSIAQQNAEMKRRDEMRQKMEEEKYRRDQEEYLFKRIEDAAVSMDDPTQALTSLMGTMPEMYRPTIEQMSSDGSFMGRFTRAKQTAALTAAKQALEFAQAAGVQDPKGVNQFLQTNGFSPETTKLAVGYTNQLWSEHWRTVRRQASQDALNEYQTIIALGDRIGGDALTEIARRRGWDATVVSEIRDEFDRRKAIVDRSETQAAVKDVVSDPTVMAAIALGGEEGRTRLDTIIERRAAGLPEHLRASFKEMAREEINFRGDVTQVQANYESQRRIIDNAPSEFADEIKKRRANAMAIGGASAPLISGTKNKDANTLIANFIADVASRENIDGTVVANALNQPANSDVLNALKSGDVSGAEAMFGQKVLGRPVKTETQAMTDFMNAKLSLLGTPRMSSDNKLNQTMSDVKHTSTLVNDAISRLTKGDADVALAVPQIAAKLEAAERNLVALYETASPENRPAILSSLGQVKEQRERLAATPLPSQRPTVSTDPQAALSNAAWELAAEYRRVRESGYSPVSARELIDRKVRAIVEQTGLPELKIREATRQLMEANQR